MRRHARKLVYIGAALECLFAIFARSVNTAFGSTPTWRTLFGFATAIGYLGCFLMLIGLILNLLNKLGK